MREITVQRVRTANQERNDDYYYMMKYFWFNKMVVTLYVHG